MNGAGRARKIVNLVHLNIKGESYIVANYLEEGVAEQMLNILFSAGIEVVYTNDFIPLIEQSFAKMASQKACAASDKNSFH